MSTKHHKNAGKRVARRLALTAVCARSVSWSMMTCGDGVMIARRRASLSRASTTTPVGGTEVSELLRRPSCADHLMSGGTSCRTSGRPTAPVAPAMNTIMGSAAQCQRTALNAARTSVEKSSGSSQAAK